MTIRRGDAPTVATGSAITVKNGRLFGSEV
jgi:hypothetical protein